jgi:hypothetical protein
MGTDVGYVRVATFRNGAAEELRTQSAALVKGGATTLGGEIGAWEAPFGEVARIIGQGPLREIHRGIGGVEDLNPIGPVAVFIDEPRAQPWVGSHEFGDDDLPSCGGGEVEDD